MSFKRSIHTGSSKEKNQDSGNVCSLSLPLRSPIRSGRNHEFQSPSSFKLICWYTVSWQWNLKGREESFEGQWKILCTVDPPNLISLEPPWVTENKYYYLLVRMQTDMFLLRGTVILIHCKLKVLLREAVLSILCPWLLVCQHHSHKAVKNRLKKKFFASISAHCWQ